MEHILWQKLQPQQIYACRAQLEISLLEVARVLYALKGRMLNKTNLAVNHVARGQFLREEGACHVLLVRLQLWEPALVQTAPQVRAQQKVEYVQTAPQVRPQQQVDYVQTAPQVRAQFPVARVHLAPRVRARQLVDYVQTAPQESTLSRVAYVSTAPGENTLRIQVLLYVQQPAQAIIRS